MKRFSLLIFIILIHTTSYAQELQFQIGSNKTKFIFETFVPIEKHSLYGYAEYCMSDTSSSYMQLFYEYELCNFTSIHIEYRSLKLDANKWQNTFIAGLTLPIISKDVAFVKFSPLYRFENIHLWQTTLTYGVSYKNITFDGYFDLYGTKKVNAFSENKFKIHFNKFIIGTNIEYSLYDLKHQITPYIMFGFNI